MERPMTSYSDDKDTMNGEKLGNMCKGIMVIEPFNLSVAFNHKAGIVPFNGDICSKLSLEDPFTADGKASSVQV
jgi:hypothetical protein